MTPIRTILVPTDFSPQSNHALSTAAALAREHGARLVVVNVELLCSDDPPPSSHAEESFRRACEERLDRFCKPARGVTLEKRLTRGAPAEEILRVAEASDCDLIVMGTHGRTGLGRLLLGSVTEQVMRRAKVSMLAIRVPADDAESESGDEAETLQEAGGSPVRTILVPMDFSKNANYAFDTAISLARDSGARVILLHVEELEEPIWSGELPAAYDAEVVLRKHARKRLRTCCDAVTGVAVEWRSTSGRPAEEILRVADESHCDLIIMSTHGSRGLDRLLFGSVAEEVLRRTKCPLLVVKTPVRTVASHDPMDPAFTKVGPPRSEKESSLVPTIEQHTTPPKADADKIVVLHGLCPCTGHPVSYVHHHEFPEVVGEGDTDAEGVNHLTLLLGRARDNAGGDWRRDAIDRAVEDAAEFGRSLPPDPDFHKFLAFEDEASMEGDAHGRVAVLPRRDVP
ncbi:universal stress protein [Paludisphaera borealis]|uniref:Universal stress protein n=1 Tax=Paludisphaera borealis TaxID=1387353 RepID=A0A1U7CNP5_9BACT|nr:universal stress protein [Paludisphaera borealis]APW60560.1 Universal stress protein [Paludisphaera borealis]